jgi:hypothetical protein
MGVKISLHFKQHSAQQIGESLVFSIMLTHNLYFVILSKCLRVYHHILYQQQIIAIKFLHKYIHGTNKIH